MKTDLDKLKKDIAWLINQVKCFMSVFPAATTWSTNHSATTGNKYLKDTLVWDNGFIYKCLVDNNSNPTSNSFYWEKVTKGWLLQQEQADWNATGGPSFIRNKPTSIGGGTEEDPIFVAWLDTDPLGDFLTFEEDPVFSSWLASDPLSPYYLATNPAGYITSSALSPYLTIIDAAATYQPIGSYLTSISGLNISLLNNDSGYITSSSLTPYLTITSASTTYFPIPTGTISQYLRGDGSLATFPTIPTSLLSNTTPDPYLGLRLQPSDTSNNGFYINKSVNQAVGYYARNTDNVGNGAVSAFYVGGTGTLYENYAGFFHANNGYFVPYLRGKNGISSNNDFFFVGYEGAGFDFRTGAGTFGGETSKFSISNAGVLQIGVQPALDNTITEILGRKSDGTIIRIDKPTNGLPTGGSAGQILTKVDATDYNATWQDNYADWTSVVKHTVKNNGASGTITKGTAVYVTGSNGTNMLVGRASNTSEATSSKTMGLMQSDITTTGGTQTGFVITEGLLGGLNTAGQTAGDPVWLGVNGALIYGLINKPYAPAHLVFIGIVTKVSAGSGEIFVKIQNGFELNEIHDVDLKSNLPTNNQLLAYESATSLWKNKSLEELGSTTNLISDGLPGTPVTGGTTLTRSLIKSYLIPANTFAAGDTLEIWAIGSKVNTNTTFYISLNINTSNTIAGATEIGRAFSNTVNITYMPFLRVYNFTTSTNIRGAVTNSGSNLETNLIGTSVSNTTFNTAVDNWILFAVTPVTGGTADIMNIEKVIIRKNKYKVTV